MGHTFLIVVLLSLTACTTPQINKNSLAQAPAAPVARKLASDPDEELRQKLAERWSSVIADPNTPQFLKDSADEEAIYAGAPLTSEESKALLAADEVLPTEKMSELLSPARTKFISLSRQMKRKYLIELLKAGRIDLRAGRYGTNTEGDDRPGVYLQLMKPSDKKFNWGDVELQFEAAILDRTDYLINPSWNYGRFDIYSAAPTVNPGRVKYYIEIELPRREQNEVVFSQPVSLPDFLSAIYVPKGQRAKLLAEIKAAKISPPARLESWEKIVGEK